MTTSKNKLIVITGATSGFGKATAELLSQNGFGLILTGRRKERLDNLKINIGVNTEVHILHFDVQSVVETKKAFNSLAPNVLSRVTGLINNAGLALGRTSIDSGDLEDWNQMFDTNVKGVLHVSQCLFPSLKANKGSIINIGSIAGKEVYPNNNNYCASKFAVYAITQTMRIDLAQYGVRVSHIAPGAAETEFSEVRFKGDKEIASSVYQGFKPLQAVDIAETIFFILSRPSHVNINDLVIMPTAQPSSQILIK